MNIKESLGLTNLLRGVRTKKSIESCGKLGRAANKNLDLDDVNAANPYLHKFDKENYSNQTSRRTEKSLQRKMSMPKRIASAKSSKFKRSETHRSKKMSRRGSLKSRKSLVTPSSKKSNKNKFKRRSTKHGKSIIP